ncbi:hypothetical protein AB7M35_002180 [Amorphus suaedae]
MSVSPPSFTAFAGTRRIASGSAGDVAVALKRAVEAGEAGLLVFEDAAGRSVDFDLGGPPEQVRARADAAQAQGAGSSQLDDAPRGRGRPRLGVVGREVTLLPRHWDWLAGQPGGASVALRKLIDEKRAAGRTDAAVLSARTAADSVMGALAGDLPNYEEASRALYRGDADRYANLLAEWPRDVRSYVLRLAAPVFATDETATNAQSVSGATLT